MKKSPWYDAVVEDEQKQGGGDHGSDQRMQRQVEKLKSTR